MSIIMNRFCIALCMLLLTGLSHAQKIDIELSNPMEIGKEDLLFGSIAAVCEDKEGNFYVVDQIEAKVFKFSTEGKLLTSFGQKGQGPGDFQRPHRISFTANGNLAVADDSEGSLVKTFHTAQRDQFSISIPDETGRKVMFNFNQPAYAPALIYAQNRGHTAIALSDSYRIQILDDKGDTVNTIAHESPRNDLSKKERKHFEKHFKELGKMRGWPNRAVRDIIKKIPGKKVFFDRLLLTDKHVFVFRIPEDVSNERTPLPVDVFNLNGRLLGSTQMPAKPGLISERRMYFMSSDEDGNIYLVVADYKLNS
jgi:hypothetical protein